MPAKKLEFRFEWGHIMAYSNHMFKNAPPFPFFSQRLRHLRRTMGIKQQALAHDLSVDQTTISRWESGLQTPEPEVQQKALAALSGSQKDDAALRRLVENATNHVHLVEDATHICLAYSHKRAENWRTTQRALLGVSLWQFATDEIRQAEAELAESNWWTAKMPKPKTFQTSEKIHDEIVISAGGIMWERLYLNDGTPVRLVTGV